MSDPLEPPAPEPATPAPVPPAPAAAPLEAEPTVEYTQAPLYQLSLHRDRRLYKVGLVGLAGGLAYYAYTARVDDPFHLYLGMVIFALASLPALFWARRSDTSLPIFETFMLTGINTYAIPLFTGHQQVLYYTPEVVTKAATAVIFFQTLAILTYFNMKGRPRKTPFWTEEVISEKYSRFLSYGMALTSIYTALNSFFPELLFQYLPSGTEGVLRAVFFGIGIVCTFITCRRWGLNLLPRGDRIFFTVNLVIQFFFLTVSLYLVSGISILVLALLGYVSGSKKLPILLLVTIVPFIGLLHSGKSSMREKYWSPGNREHLTLAGVPSFYWEWLQDGLNPAEAQEKKNTAKLLERTSLLHIMCLIIYYTPERQPYLYGKTYQHIPAQLIPRFFYPGKPQAHISTSTLGIYYGLQTEEETTKTTIGFGMLAEAYANFGFAGLAGLAVLLGVLFRKIVLWSAASPTLSYGGLLMVVLMAWSFQVEYTLSIWLSSFFQACVAILGTPMLVRSIGL